MQAWEVGVMVVEVLVLVAGTWTILTKHKTMPTDRLALVLVCVAYLMWHAGKTWGGAQVQGSEAVCIDVGVWECLDEACCMEVMPMPGGSFAYMRHYDCEGEP